MPFHYFWGETCNYLENLGLIINVTLQQLSFLFFCAPNVDAIEGQL